jgi:hypothetical protein
MAVGDLRNLCGRSGRRSDLDDGYFYGIALIAIANVERTRSCPPQRP